MPVHRRSPPAEASAAAHHEAGHAVAITTGFRTAAWLPRPAPPLPVRYIEVVESTPGETGSCVGANIYSMAWPEEDRIAPRYRDLMERQITIHLAGGIAEAVYRGERRAHAVLAFAAAHCAIDGDMANATAVLGDLRRLTGRRFDPEHFVESTLALMLDNWSAVTALASALVEHRRIAGDVERIIDRASCDARISLLLPRVAWVDAD